MRLKISIFLSFLFLSIHTINAQDEPSSTKDAVAAFDKGEYFDAQQLYKKAFGKEKNKAVKAEILFKIAECWRFLNDVKQQIPAYDKAVKAKYPDPIAIYYLGMAQKMSAQYAAAIATFNQYKAANPSDKKIDDVIKSCQLSDDWMKHPTRYKVNNEAVFNTKFADFAASYGKKDYKTLLFTSSREEAMGSSNDPISGNKFTDLFETTLDKKGKWSSAKPISPPVNSPANEGTSCFDRKGVEMYFTRCSQERNKIVRCKIYSTKRRGTSWEDPVLLPFCTTDSATFGQPSLSPDETHLYFSSNLDGGYGGLDIWVSTHDKSKKTWSDPVNLGASVNTDGDEMYPFMHADGTLYFSSDGHLGMGCLDIYSSKYDGKNWGEAVNMQYPINSASDDFAIIFQDNEEKGYLSSNRDGGRGGDDIWSFYKPPLIFTLKGVARDIDTKKVLADVKISLVGSNGTSFSVMTDRSGGYFFDSAQIKQNTSYHLEATKDKYLGDRGDETTVGLTASKDLVHDFVLKTTEVAIVLPNVLYPLAKWNLLPVSYTSLDSLVKTMNANPNIVIELRANTDTRADDAYNLDLSEKRAKSCVDYLVSKGIDPDRLKPKGYGEAVPREIKVDTEVELTEINGVELTPHYKTTFKAGTKFDDTYINGLKTLNEQEAAHQMNRRTEFYVLRSDFVPKKKDK